MEVPKLAATNLAAAAVRRGLIVGLSVVTAVIVAFLSKDFRHAIRDAAQWLYPNGVIAILGALCVILTLLASYLVQRAVRAEEAAAGLQEKLNLTSAENVTLTMLRSP